jgi:DnaJ domain
MDELEAYSILELLPDADLAEVKGAFRRLSKRYHPDKHSQDNQSWAADNFRRVKHAYEALAAILQNRESAFRLAQLARLRSLEIAADATLQESILLEIAPSYCLDVGAWGKELPFYSRLALKLSGPSDRLQIGVFKSADFENARYLRDAVALGRLDVPKPPPSVTVLTKIDAHGHIRISLLGEHRFLDFEWHAP